MSRYVTKKHGIIIGSGNVFFYRDENDVFHDFPCIFSTSSYSFDQINTFNVKVRTPAEQLIWDIEYHDVVETFGSKEYVSQRPYPEVSWEVRRWLNENAEGWGVQLPENRSKSIFLKKRKQALALYDFIDSHLSGIRIKD